MSVCGEKPSGVCVMGKCPYIKLCCPIIWDKYGKIDNTNKGWIQSATTEQLADWIVDIVFNNNFKKNISQNGYINMHSYKTEVIEWLNSKHDKND